MKQFVGKQVMFFVQEMGKFKAKVVGDRKDMILVQGESDSFPWRIIKSKIVGFMPLEQVDDDVNLLVLGCENPAIRCPGVKYIKEGTGFNQNDFNKFMAPCPRRCDTCRTGSHGELRTVEGAVLKEMLPGTLYGDYPDEEDKNG